MCFSNELAKKTLNHSQLIKVDQTGKLQTLHLFQDQLERFISNAIYQDEIILKHDIGMRESIGIYAEHEKNKPLMLTIIPITDVTQKQHLNTNKMIAIYIIERNLRHKLSYQLMKNMYKFSNREIEICELFINNLNLEEIIEKCGITLSSVRTYLKLFF